MIMSCQYEKTLSINFSISEKNHLLFPWKVIRQLIGCQIKNYFCLLKILFSESGCSIIMLIFSDVLFICLLSGDPCTRFINDFI